MRVGRAPSTAASVVSFDSRGRRMPQYGQWIDLSESSFPHLAHFMTSLILLSNTMAPLLQIITKAICEVNQAATKKSSLLGVNPKILCGYCVQPQKAQEAQKKFSFVPLALLWLFLFI
jgi:hypothetical protein